MNLVVYINDGLRYLARGLWTYNGYTSLALGTVLQVLANLQSCQGYTPKHTALNIFKRMGGQPANGKEPIVSEPIYEPVGEYGAFAEPWATDTMVEVDIADPSHPTVKLGGAFNHKQLRDIADRESILVIPPDGPEAIAFDLALQNFQMETWELHDLEAIVAAAEMDNKKTIAIAGAEEDDDILLLKAWW